MASTTLVRRTRRAPAFEQLAALEQAIRDAQAHADDTKLKHDGIVRRLGSVDSPVREYHREVGAGTRKADEKTEGELLRQVRENRQTLTDQREALAARLVGATEAIDARRQDVASFIAQHRSELSAELVPRSLAAQEGVVNAKAELEGALGEWATVANLWRRFLEAWHESPGQVPPNPYGGATSDLERAFAPFENGRLRDARRHYPMPVDVAPGGPE